LTTPHEIKTKRRAG